MFMSAFPDFGFVFLSWMNERLSEDKGGTNCGKGKSNNGRFERPEIIIRQLLPDRLSGSNDLNWRDSF